MCKGGEGQGQGSEQKAPKFTPILSYSLLPKSIITVFIIITYAVRHLSGTNVSHGLIGKCTNVRLLGLDLKGQIFQNR